MLISKLVWIRSSLGADACLPSIVVRLVDDHLVVTLHVVYAGVPR